MLSAVKLLLKGEVGVYALNSPGNYIVVEKSWNCVFEFVREPCQMLAHLCAQSGLSGSAKWANFNQTLKESPETGDQIQMIWQK